MKAKLTRSIIALVALSISIFVTGCDAVKKSPKSRSAMKMEDYNDVSFRIGYSSGALPQYMAETSLPKPKKSSYLVDLAAYMDLVVGKIDAYVVEETIAAEALKLYSKNMFICHRFGQPIDIAFGISRYSKIPDLKKKVDDFIKRYKETGTIQDMLYKWLTSSDIVSLDNLQVAEPEMTLRVGTVGTVPPLNYYERDNLAGFDIEIIEKFAKTINAKVEYVIDTFPNCIKNLKEGNVDIVSASLTITDSRKKIIDYSEPIYTTNVVMLARREDAFDKTTTECSVYRLFFKDVVLLNEEIKVKIKENKTLHIGNITVAKSDEEAIEAIKSGKIDAYITTYENGEKHENSDYYLTNIPLVDDENEKLGIVVKSRDFFEL